MCKALFELVISNRARKSLKRMPEHYIRKVILALEALRQDAAPVPEYEVRRLHGLKDTYRIRLGDARIEYEVAWESRQINIIAVDFRRRAYR